MRDGRAGFNPQINVSGGVPLERPSLRGVTAATAIRKDLPPFENSHGPAQSRRPEGIFSYQGGHRLGAVRLHQPGAHRQPRRWRHPAAVRRRGSSPDGDRGTRDVPPYAAGEWRRPARVRLPVERRKLASSSLRHNGSAPRWGCIISRPMRQPWSPAGSATMFPTIRWAVRRHHRPLAGIARLSSPSSMKWGGGRISAPARSDASRWHGSARFAWHEPAWRDPRAAAPFIACRHAPDWAGDRSGRPGSGGVMAARERNQRCTQIHTDAARQARL
jgi:hypothetical protein